MSTSIIIGMLGISIVGSVAQKVLVAFGKSTESEYVGVATMCGLGATTLGVVANLIGTLSTF